ncbi:MAG: threonyl-tRNA synthetase editing domain-containing protein [Desulfobacterales bacterium]|jgi:hypothetical protein
MRILFWYCDHFGWQPALKTLEDAGEAAPGRYRQAVAAFVHVEPGDIRSTSKAETKLVKNAKWLARKWDTSQIILHSFTHLDEGKADAGEARELLERAGERLVQAGYQVAHTPYGYYLDLDIKAPGHPLARIFKHFD